MSTLHPGRNALGFKASETLLGIETGLGLGFAGFTGDGFKASETLLGIETKCCENTPITVLTIQSI